MSTNIIAVVDDLFFASKIRGTAEQVGASIRFARSVEGLIDALGTNHPSLIVVDLQSQSCDPLVLAERLKQDAGLRSIPLLGFFSHVQVELKNSAEAAGFDRVVPRSFLAKNLAEILAGTI